MLGRFDAMDRQFASMRSQLASLRAHMRALRSDVRMLVDVVAEMDQEIKDHKRDRRVHVAG